METPEETRLPKDPNAVLDYGWDWTGWLTDGDTIASVDVDVTRGDITVDSSSHTGTTTTAWVSGGTAGEPAAITFRVTTTQGRTDDRTLTFDVKNR